MLLEYPPLLARVSDQTKFPKILSNTANVNVN